MKETEFAVRMAGEEDCGLILSFIKKLAAYERLEDQVVATEEGLRKTMFADKRAEVLLGFLEEEPVAFALFFHNYSTFLGKPGIYLEDLFVEESCRGKGYGRRMFQALARVARERDCERLDWSCLSWNKSSMEFYQRMGAVCLEEWVPFRLEGDALRELAGER